MEAFSAKAVFRLLLTLLLPPLASCSLNYAQNQPESSSSPEFTLRTASFFRYEDNAISFSLDSPRIEQYASPSVTFVEDAVFASYSRDGVVETKGRCSLLGISQPDSLQDESELTFYGDVFLEQLEDGLTLEGDALKWHTGTGRVAAPAEGVVTLTKGDLTLEGEGFSAQEKGTAFSFASNVSGFIITADDGEGAAE